VIAFPAGTTPQFNVDGRRRAACLSILAVRPLSGLPLRPLKR
jgi:hypothetical protein